MEYRNERENFIPFRKSDLLEMCLGKGGLAEKDRESFKGYYRLLASLFHFEFHHRLEGLKDAYAPFDPDADTVSLAERNPEDLVTLRRNLVEGLTEILEAANYERITQEEVDRAMAEESLFKIRLQVDFDDFEEMILFSRGERVKTEVVKSLFGLRKRKMEIPTFERVAIYVHFKDQAWFETRKRKDLNFKPGSMMLKLFRNIPKADLEMLFPNTQVRMKIKDKVIMGVPALAGGVVVAATKLGAVFGLIYGLIKFQLGYLKEQPVIDSAMLVGLGAGLGALGGFIFKQWSNYKNRKIKFMKTLTENLYFKNLDNNAGVFHYLIDDAEEEECKEALLAYWGLHTAQAPLTEKELDQRIEEWLAREWDCAIDFEVDDALAKLTRLQLVEQEGECFRALPLAEANRQLDELWDNFFEYNQGRAGSY